MADYSRMGNTYFGKKPELIVRKSGWFCEHIRKRSPCVFRTNIVAIFSVFEKVGFYGRGCGQIFGLENAFFG